MDFNDLRSRFEKSQFEPDSADVAWKRLYGDKPFNLETLGFQERLATAKAWRQESIKLAQEDASRKERELASTQRRNLITSLCQQSKSRQLDKGERDMHDTINTNDANRMSYEYEPNEQNKVRETSAIYENEEQQQEQLRQDQQRQEEQKQQELRQDEQRQEEQRLDEQQQEELRQDEQRQEELRQDEQRQDEQRQDEQQQEELRQDEQQQDEHRQDDQRQEELSQDQQRQDEQHQETKNREDDNRAYEEAQARYQELEEFNRARQMEQRFGPDSADGILSRFLDSIQKGDRQPEPTQEYFEPNQLGADVERPSYDDNIPDHLFGDAEHEYDDNIPDHLFDGTEHDDFYSQLDELLNSFDRSLDVDKDIDLSVEGRMLIDELDRGFDIDRDVDNNWSLDTKATGKELDLDSLFSDMQLDEGAPFSYEKFDRVLYGSEALSVHEKSEMDQRIESWQDNAFDPILIHEQNDRDNFSEREMNYEDIEPLNSPEHSQLEQQNLDQIMQQQVQQNMQTQIQQTFMQNNERSESFASLGQSKEDKEQEHNREDDGGVVAGDRSR